MADRQRLAQVLLNLLSNAVKYNRPDGRVWVTVEAAPPEDGGGPGGVADRRARHRSGIPPERMEELFVPFSRLGADASEVEGTGLGLALSQRLTEAMGGAWRCESTVGVGSTFTRVSGGRGQPLDRSAIRAADPAARPAPAGARPRRCCTSRTTWPTSPGRGDPGGAAGDHPGPGPAGAAGAGPGLPARSRPDPAGPAPPRHPGRRGPGAPARRPAHPRIPVVVISADATPRRIERLREGGALAYLTKPLDVDEFLETVDEVLQRREG
jgi:hypothetical protein